MRKRQVKQTSEKGPRKDGRKKGHMEELMIKSKHMKKELAKKGEKGPGERGSHKGEKGSKEKEIQCEMIA